MERSDAQRVVYTPAFVNGSDGGGGGSVVEKKRWWCWCGYIGALGPKWGDTAAHPPAIQTHNGGRG